FGLAVEVGSSRANRTNHRNSVGSMAVDADLTGQLDGFGQRSDQLRCNLVAVADTHGAVVEITAAEVQLDALGNGGADGAAKAEISTGAYATGGDIVRRFSRQGNLEHVELGFARDQGVP